MQQILWAVVLLCSATLAAAGTCTSSTKKPALTFGQTWTPDSGCSKGGTYDTDTSHCHCWSFCGYICEPRSAPAPAPTTKKPAPAATTAASNTCATKKPATLPSGSTYATDAGCSKGNTYNTATSHCHCWSHCGYICDPKSAPVTTKKPAPAATTAASNACASKRPGNLPSGSTYLVDPNCPNGNTYDTNTSPKKHCHCWSHCGYICDPKGSSGGTTRPPARTTTKKPVQTTTPASGSGSKCPFGGVWVPPNNPTYRCTCKSFNQQPYYLCVENSGSTSSTTPASGGSTTAGTGSTATTVATVATTAPTGATTAAATTAAGTTAAATTAAGTTAAATTAAATTAAATTAAATTAAATTAAATTAAATTAAATTAAATTAAATTAAVTTIGPGRRRRRAAAGRAFSWLGF